MGDLGLGAREKERGRTEVRPGIARVDASVEPDFDFLSAEYAALFEQSTASAFQHPLWLAALYEKLALPRSAQKVVVTVRDRGRLVAVLPLIQRTKTGFTLIESADLGVSDYAAPVVADDWIPGADLPMQIASVLPAFDLMRIKPIREETVSKWQALLGGDVLPLDFQAHHARLASTVDAWRAEALEPSFAKRLDKASKRFFKTPGATFALLANEHEIGDALRQLAALRAGRFDGDPIQQDFVRDFYEQVAASGFRQNFTRIYALKVGDDPVGYLFGLTWKGRFHYLLVGCDYTRHGKYSPGLILCDSIIKDWIGAGGTIFDFTIGDEAYKRDFGVTSTLMFILKRAPTWRGKLASASFDAREQLRRMNWGRKPVATAAVKTGGGNEA
ncbi:MAG TPA: GNAT family N-acetyltransferase [Rhizobiaceae bacterium]|nr:GNAT family N-acetyltransferase [Rhizobiaceae bacterium]